MTWEQPPGRDGRRPRWLVPALLSVAAVAIVAAVAVAAGGRRATLAVGPTEPPVDAGLDDVVHPERFAPERLAPLETTTETSGRGPLLPGAPRDYTIVAGDDTGLRLVDTATGDLRRVQVLRSAPGSLSSPTVFAVGDDLIVDADGDVERIGPAPRPVRIADGHRSIRTFSDDSVWVIDNASPFVSGVASRVTFDGAVRDRIGLPAVAQPLVGTADGLLIGVPGAIAYVPTDGDRRVIARGQVIAADRERLAWLECAGDLTCAVVVGTIDDPDQLRMPLDRDMLPAGFLGLPVGAFSPDGRWLAMPQYRGRGGGQLDRVTISVIDLTTGSEAFTAQGSSVTPYDSPLAWTPDSQWLIFVSGTDVRAWRAGAATSAVVDADLQPVRALTVR